MLEVQGSLMLGAAHEEEQTHKLVKWSNLKIDATCRIMFVVLCTFNQYETYDSCICKLTV
jgi:hypothetical protein